VGPAGGRVTVGVVRVGDTVRRPISGDRTLQHNLLAHLKQRGFAGCPRFLGIDELGREVLSWLPGHVPAGLGYYTDAQLCAAAQLLRRFHDATADFAPVQEQGAEVICHHDFGPCNTVFSDAVPCGMIDFDTIAPGLRLWDLGYSAWLWLDIGDPDLEYTADAQLRRLAVFKDAYGLSNCSLSQIAAFILARQTTLAKWAKKRGQAEMAAWAISSAEWTVCNIRQQAIAHRLPRLARDRDPHAAMLASPRPKLRASSSTASRAHRAPAGRGPQTSRGRRKLPGDRQAAWCLSPTVARLVG
jgi:hypothetical protein